MENTKIVVVDDDRDIRDSLQVILEGKQYTVITAVNYYFTIFGKANS